MEESLIMKRWKLFLKNQKIEYIRGSPYHPQSQGAVEGFNRTKQNFLYLSKDMNLDEFNLKIQYLIFICTITIGYIVQQGSSLKR